MQIADVCTRQPALCLEFGCQLSFALDNPHYGLDHLRCGALAADISCVQLQDREELIQQVAKIGCHIRQKSLLLLNNCVKC